jgi:hypothetical protein
MMSPPVAGLPPAPWIVAEDDPADTEVVAEFPGQFEPRRECVFYGSQNPGGIFGNRPPRTASLRLRRFHNVLLAPHHVFLSFADGRLLPVTYALGHFISCLHPGLKDARAPQTYDPWHCTGTATRVDEPVFLAEPGWDGYGHVLLEAAPKLAMLSGAPEGIPVVTSGKIFDPLFAAFGVDRARLASFSGPVYCRTLYVPDPPVDLSGNFHSLARSAYAQICHFVGGGTTARRRLYWSRSRVEARRLINEGEIEAMFVAYGFTVVNPELLPVDEQIRLIASAEMIAGPGGSAIHSLVFASADCKVLILSSDRWFAEIDQYIAKADGQVGYVVGSAIPVEGVHDRQWSWEIDASNVEHAIRAHFGL